MAAARAFEPRRRAARAFKLTDKTSPVVTPSYIERMPCEILLKILSHLDASELHVVSHVNKRFYQLANEDSLWKKVYSTELKRHSEQKPTSMEAYLLKQTLTVMQEDPVDNWKLHYFKTIGLYDLKKRTCFQRTINTHTGLPVNTGLQLKCRNRRCNREKKGQIPHVRKSHVTWELIITNKSGHEITLELGYSHAFDTSVTLGWYAGDYLPDCKQISTLQLYGVRKIDLDCPGVSKPGWRSLIATLDFKASTASAKNLAMDKLIEMKLLQPGVIMGVWRDKRSVAFFMCTLHTHKLFERSVLGSSTCPYMELGTAQFDDVDTQYGLHDYQLHVSLHNTESEFMSERFRGLFCHKDQISDGLIPLVVISSKDVSQHKLLSDNITFPWQSQCLRGSVRNCFIMSLTLLEEFGKPFLCIATPVSIEADKKVVCYDYDSVTYLMKHQDSDCQVEMTFVWLTEKKQFALASLIVYLSVKRVNEYFGRNC